MQPNDQQGFYRPDQDAPATPQAPASAAAPIPQQTASAPQAPAQDTPAATPVEAPEVPVDEYDEDVSIGEPITWTAHEYIHREKGALWFFIFAIVVIGLGAVSIFLMKSWTFAVLLIVIAIVVVVYSRRPPRELNYSLTDEGLTVDTTLYKLSTFKSFGVIRDGEEYSVMLIPTQRFQPGISVYFPEEAGEAIVDALGSQLPMKELHLDIIDRAVRLLRL